MSDTDEKAEASELLKKITEDTDVIRELAKDRKFGKGMKELEIEFKQPGLARPPAMKNLTQEELAEGYYKQIDQYLDSLKRLTPERKETLSNQMNSATIIAAILPLVMTLVSGGLFLISHQWLTFFASLVDVVPPYAINTIKGKTENYYKGSKLQATLIDMKYRISRLVALDQLKDDILKELDKELKDTGAELSQIGTY